MRTVAFLWVIVVPALILLPVPAMAQGCGIGVAATPPVVNYPGGSLPPAGGVTFAETFDVNYSTALANSTILLEYSTPSGWRTLQNFTGNKVGFTELGHGLDSGWAGVGTNTVRAVSGPCVSEVASFDIKRDAGAWTVDAGAYLAMAAFVALFFLAGRRLGWKKFVLLGAAAYLAVSPFTGQRYDVYFLVSSGVRILQHVNPFDPGSPPIYPTPLKWAYPPLYALYSALSFAVYQLVTGSPLPSVASLTWPGWLTSTYNVFEAFVPANLPVLAFLLKLPMVAAALVTGELLRRITGKDSLAVWWVASPLVILVAAAWGQIDPIATALAVASVYAFRRGKTYHAYLLASFGAAVKVWPALLIPLFLVSSLQRDGRRALKPLVAVVPAVAVTVGVYAFYGNPVQSLFVLAYARGIPTFAGAFSVNGLTWQELLFVMKAPPVPLFLFIGIPAYIAILVWMYRKREGDVVKWLVVSLIVFYLTYNYVNPQYFYWIVPFLLIRGKKGAALVFTALPLVYMAFSYNIFYFVSPALLPDLFSSGASILEQLKVNVFYQVPPLFLAVAGGVPTAAYLYILYREVRPRGPESAPSMVHPDAGEIRRTS